MTTLQQTYIDNPSQSRPDLIKNDFDKLLAEKGREVILEQALPCPCKSASAGVQSNCKNCGGTGWVFINAVPTRMVLQAINVSTKVQPWSEEVRGMVSFTSFAEDEACFMDRITLPDASSIYTQVVFFRKSVSNQQFAYLAYKPKEIRYVGLYIDKDQPFRRLIEGTDFTIQDQALILSDEFQDGLDLSATIRYKHAPAFHIVEMKRETMQSFKIDSGTEVQQDMPVAGYARRAHYVLDAKNLAGDRLLSNDYQ